MAGGAGCPELSFATPTGGLVPFFLKKQENHTFRFWYRPWKKELTFLREYLNILKFVKLGIPTQELVYFGETVVAGNRRAILLTRELSGYHSLQHWVERWEEHGWPSESERKRIASSLGRAVHKLHRHRWVHRCLYPKHIFVKIEEGEVDVRFIDLEKARQRSFHHSGMLGDLGSLYRRSRAWPLRERVLFFREYFDVETLGRREKEIWKVLSE